MKDFDILNKEREDLTKELDNLLGKYKKNVENVPEEDLNGKYKNSFSKLKKQISIISNKLAGLYLCAPFAIKKDDEEIIKKVKVEISEHKKAFTECLFEKADIQSFIQELLKVQATLAVIILTSGGYMQAFM